MNLEKAYESILYYCIKKNIEVVPSNVWSYDHTERIITEVWRGKATKSWVYTMLHELGHSLNRSKKSFSYKSWRISEIGESVTIDKVATVQIMREEIEAWETGLKLAKRLNIQIERKDYDKYASNCLMKYMKELPLQYEARKTKK
jgi:hypothetical protein